MASTLKGRGHDQVGGVSGSPGGREEQVVDANTFEAALVGFRVVPVLVIERAGDAAPLGERLKAGGLPCAEVTLRTPEALSAIRVLAADPEMLVGAGTVTRVEQVDDAVEAGARFIVSPGLDASVVARSAELGVPAIPGVSTPTEIMAAMRLGVEVVKFFPAEASGGIAMLRALGGPFPSLRFIPTGGITTSNLSQYLERPEVIAVGGTWIAPPDLVAGSDWAQIERRTAEAVVLAAGWA